MKPTTKFDLSEGWDELIKEKDRHPSREITLEQRKDEIRECLIVARDAKSWRTASWGGWLIIPDILKGDYITFQILEKTDEVIKLKYLSPEIFE